jgi:hypothetical protein
MLSGWLLGSFPAGSASAVNRVPFGSILTLTLARRPLTKSQTGATSRTATFLSERAGCDRGDRGAAAWAGSRERTDTRAAETRARRSLGWDIVVSFLVLLIGGIAIGLF